MSYGQLHYSMFESVFFPNEAESPTLDGDLKLERLLRFLPPAHTELAAHPLVIFDFETTGLDSSVDRIIEIGGLKVHKGMILEEFSTLVRPEIPLPAAASKVTGITEDMLKDAPLIHEVLPGFIKFCEGSILVAHNAEFDMAFLRNACQRLGYRLEWPCFCTLKLARTLLPDLESRNLDTLAAHYGLSFEARHRSVGDCKVTSAVLQAFLKGEGQHLSTWDAMQPFAVS